MWHGLKSFLNDERGAVTVDWIVLTGVLVGTGISVLSTMSSGVETASMSVSSQMRGQIIRSSFGSESCHGGISALQAREHLRVASTEEDAIDVLDWMETYHAGLNDSVIVEEYSRLSDNLGNGGNWTRDHTIMTALECEMVMRGLD